MSDVKTEHSPTEHFQGFSDNRYQHGMHTLAWVSLWLIVGIGVACGIFGVIIGVGD